MAKNNKAVAAAKTKATINQQPTAAAAKQPAAAAAKQPAAAAAKQPAAAAKPIAATKAAATAATPTALFAGAQGSKQPIAAAAMVAFIMGNGGIGALGLQLNAAALVNGVLFGGGKLATAMQPNNTTGLYGGRAVILWACINGLPAAFMQGKQSKASLAAAITTTMPVVGKVIPLAQIQLAHTLWQAGITHNTSTPAGGQANQNALLAILNGGFANSAQTALTYGTSYGSIVTLA